MRAYPPLLSEMIESAKRQKAKGAPLQAIFDLDSTLFDVSHRIAKILHHFADLPEIREKYPEAASFISRLEPHRLDYGVKRTLNRVGFKLPDEDFAKTIEKYWKKHFFADTYLMYDQPYPGATAFVNDLYKAGGEISYLTGRDIPRMFQGTVASLKQHGFPVDPEHTNVALKPNTGISDSEFKKDFFLKMDKSPGPVWFFENEPKNIHLVMEHCPHIEIVFVETVHSEKMELPPPSIRRISGFEN
jgi:hypothetical protein